MPLVDPVSMASSLPPSRRRRAPPGRSPLQEEVFATEISSPVESSHKAGAAADHSTLLARAARHGGPLLLLAVLALSFDALVDQSNSSQDGSTAATTPGGDGVVALAGLLVATTVVQATSAVVGLPPAGSDAESQKKRRARKDLRKPNVIVTTFLSLLLTAFAIPLVHVVLVLFGAPFLAHIASTLLCAAHIAMLGLFPVVYTHGTDSPGWMALVSGDVSFFTALPEGLGLDTAAGLWGTCVGAWLGAVPIPLDWDRPWQRWPLTVVVGAYIGHAVGRLVGAAAQRR